jgi:hypothetical protein
MMTNEEYIKKCLDREITSESLVNQDIKKIDGIYTNNRYINDELASMILDLKIVRMKKVMAKYETPILSVQQAEEIWRR